jgi:hypothetical protein
VVAASPDWSDCDTCVCRCCFGVGDYCGGRAVMPARGSVWRFVACLVALAAVMIALALAGAAIVRDRIEMEDARSQRAAAERSELLAIVSDLQADLKAERAEDDTELRQAQCEDAHRRAVEYAEAVEAAAVLAALRAGSSKESVDAYDVAARELTEAVIAQGDYVDAGRPLPCPID